MDAKQIEEMSLFSGLDKQERTRVAQQADEVDVPAGKRLAREGGLAYEFFVIRTATKICEFARLKIVVSPLRALRPDERVGRPPS